MSKLYAVAAMEQNYHGLHGMCSHEVIECENEKEAFDYGKQASYDIMEQYDEISESLTHEAEWISGEDEGLEGFDFDEAYEQCALENLEYYVWEVKPTNKSLVELDELFYDDPDEFIENYCIEI